MPSLAVLLVEDDPVSQVVATTFLKRLGHRVQLAEDGGAAVAGVASGSFDLVLMDISLPGMDGIEATRRIRSLPDERRRIPIVAMSAHVFRDEIERHLAAGMDAFLGKPIFPELLDGAIRSAWRGQRLSAFLPPAARPDQAPLLAQDVLVTDLRALGRDRLQQILALFRETAVRYMERLAAAAASADPGRLAAAAHAVKSAASAVGLQELGERAGAIETAARRGEVARAIALAGGIAELYRISLVALEEGSAELLQTAAE
jgi:CheY-like chemotaxis protein